MNSSVNKFAASQGAAQAAEESGWTQYLEDFSSDQRDFSSYSDDSFGSPSLVSDAASPANAPRNFSNNKESIACTSKDGPQFPKRLNVKKQKKKKYSCDDLEDTASSPVNSPKVSSLKRMDTSYRRTDDSIGNFMEKDPGSDHHSAQRPDERSSINLEVMKKRGLCLMPFSMLVNYL